MPGEALTAFNLFDVLRNAVWPPTPLPEEFPRVEWDRWRSVCRERWSYFTGKFWEQQTTAGKSKVDKFPLRINPIKTFALKHAYVLFGEIPDTGASLVKTKIMPATKDEADKTLALEAENALERIYYENNKRSLMMENGILSQFLGGCVFKVCKALPHPMLPTGVRIERIIPDYFWAESGGSDMWNLRHAWVVQPITARQARQVYGVDLGLMVRDETQTLRIEHWTRDRYRVSIEGRTAKMILADGEKMPMEEENVYGVVPFVYIPHERAGSFHGSSLVEGIAPTAEEYNARIADGGDAVREESRQDLWYKNVPNGVKYHEIAPGKMAFNLGTQPAGAGDPEMGVLDKPKITAEMNTFLESLYSQMRRDGFVPPVADGEDEGSQRSALTLAFRMWPLTSHVRSERQFWTDGLNLLAEMCLIVLVYRNKNRLQGELVPEACSKISEKHLGHMKAQKWFPMIPRDREQLVNELILRAGANHVPPQKTLEKYGDIDDIDEAIDLILEWMQKLGATSDGGVAGNLRAIAQVDTGAPTIFSEIYFTTEENQEFNQRRGVWFDVQEGGDDAFPLRLIGDNIGIGSSAVPAPYSDFGGGHGVVHVAEAITAPSSNPANGFILYADPADNGQLTTRLSDGKIEKIAVPLIVKSSDESVTSSTTLQDDDDFQFGVGANEKWVYQLALYLTSVNAGGVRLGFSAPSGAAVLVNGIPTANATLLAPILTSSSPFYTNNGGTTWTFVLTISVINGANAGTFKIQFAQHPSDATASMMKAGSSMPAARDT